MAIAKKIVGDSSEPALPGIRPDVDESTAAESFEAFARRQIPALLRPARLLAGPSGAEDLVQEVLARLAQRWSRVSSMENPEGYAYRTLVNQFLSDQRRQRRAAARAPAIADVERRPTALQRVDDLDELQRALDQLPARQRAALVLKHYADLDTTQIAGLMHVRESTVRSLTARGLATLRTYFNHLEGDSDGYISRRT